jgi:hypothetical protein
MNFLDDRQILKPWHGCSRFRVPTGGGMLATTSFLLARDDLTDELLALFAFAFFFIS